MLFSKCKTFILNGSNTNSVPVWFLSISNSEMRECGWSTEVGCICCVCSVGFTLLNAPWAPSLHRPTASLDWERERSRECERTRKKRAADIMFCLQEHCWRQQLSKTNSRLAEQCCQVPEPKTALLFPSTRIPNNPVLHTAHSIYLCFHVHVIPNFSFWGRQIWNVIQMNYMTSNLSHIFQYLLRKAPNEKILAYIHVTDGWIIE